MPWFVYAFLHRPAPNFLSIEYKISALCAVHECEKERKNPRFSLDFISGVNILFGEEEESKSVQHRTRKDDIFPKFYIRMHNSNVVENVIVIVCEGERVKIRRKIFYEMRCVFPFSGCSITMVNCSRGRQSCARVRHQKVRVMQKNLHSLSLDQFQQRQSTPRELQNLFKLINYIRTRISPIFVAGSATAAADVVVYMKHEGFSHKISLFHIFVHDASSSFSLLSLLRVRVSIL